jgi:hypothetical protein
MDRLQKTTYPSGNQGMTTLHWANGHADAPKEPEAIYYQIHQKSGVSEIITFFDKYNRELRTVTIDFNGNKLYSDKLYNPKGQLWKKTLPYVPDNPKFWTTIEYYDDGRIKKETQQNGIFTEYTYAESANTITTKTGKAGSGDREISEEYNSMGQKIRVIDTESKSVEIKYNSAGLPEVYNYGSHSVILEYDINGNRIKINDPNAGTTQFKYNALGENYEKTDPNGHITKYQYDKHKSVP